MMNRKLKITIAGRGNVGSHLAKALSPTSEVNFTDCRSDIIDAGDSDLLLICVKDDAIREVASKIRNFNGVVAHTSGSVPMSVLDGVAQHYGVFYPLQTFSKDVTLDYTEIPVFIEGNSAAAVSLLSHVAEDMGCRHFPADSSLRKKLHIASVFACNFTNHLYTIADSLLKEENLDISVLLPLIKETTGKLERTLSPAKSQTGPAARGDSGVVKAHLDMLSHNDRLEKIYRMISADIFRSCGHGNPDF